METLQHDLLLLACGEGIQGIQEIKGRRDEGIQGIQEIQGIKAEGMKGTMRRKTRRLLALSFWL
jgi:hypothetical protein